MLQKKIYLNINKTWKMIICFYINVKKRSIIKINQNRKYHYMLLQEVIYYKQDNYIYGDF